MAINIYHFGDFIVQSYFDEATTRRLFDFALRNKLLGRINPPRKAFLGMAEKLLWEKRFTFEGQPYLIKGGGKELALFEDDPHQETSAETETGKTCIFCLSRHPAEDLVETEDGAVCLPCYDVRFPPCEICGERIRLPEDVDPDDGPFTCDKCAGKREK